MRYYRIKIVHRGTGAIVQSYRFSAATIGEAEQRQATGWTRYAGQPGRYRSTLHHVGERRALLTIE